jgi:hypothetical protein
MFRLTVAASVAVLLLITLRAPAASQYYAAPLQTAVPRQAPLFLEPVPQRPVPLARAGPGPQMLVPSVDDVSGVITSLPTMLTAEYQWNIQTKSDLEIAFEDLVIVFPLIVTGAVLGYAALETAKDTFEVELPEGSEGLVYAAACLGGSLALVVLTKIGVIGGLMGALAKALLDGWNLFAGVVLKGAILKY